MIGKAAGNRSRRSSSHLPHEALAAGKTRRYKLRDNVRHERDNGVVFVDLRRNSRECRPVAAGRLGLHRGVGRPRVGGQQVGVVRRRFSGVLAAAFIDHLAVAIKHAVRGVRVHGKLSSRRTVPVAHIVSAHTSTGRPNVVGDGRNLLRRVGVCADVVLGARRVFGVGAVRPVLVEEVLRHIRRHEVRPRSARINREA